MKLQCQEWTRKECSHNKRPGQIFLISFVEAKSHEITTHVFPGVIGHAFPINVTLDTMYINRGNIQKAEFTSGRLIA